MHHFEAGTSSQVLLEQNLAAVKVCFLQEAVKQAECVRSKTVGTHFPPAPELCVALADDSGCELQAASGHVA